MMNNHGLLADTMADVMEEVNELGIEELRENAGTEVVFDEGPDSLREASYHIESNGFQTMAWVMHPTLVRTLKDSVNFMARDTFTHDSFDGTPIFQDPTLDEGEGFLVAFDATTNTPLGVATPFLVKNPDGVVHITTKPDLEAVRDRMVELERLSEDVADEVSALRDELDQLAE